MCDVPGVGVDDSSVCVLQSIRATTYDFSDDEGSLPGRRQFVVAFLLQPEYKVSFDEGPAAYSTAMIVAQALLVDSGAGECDVSSLVECVDVVFYCSVRVLLSVGGNPRCVVADIRWQHRLCTVDHEKRRVLGGPVTVSYTHLTLPT